MANSRFYQRSFNGGEVSPDFWGQIADSKYQTGVARMRNFIAQPHGPAQNRPGFAFVREVKDSTKAVRLIPFTYSTTQTMVIELGAGYFRFHTQGGTLQAPAASAWSNATSYAIGDLASRLGVTYYAIRAHTNHQPPNATYWYPLPATGEYEVPNEYAEADLFDIHYVQAGDVVTLVHPGYTAKTLNRNGAYDWTLEEIYFTPPAGNVSGVTATATVATLPSVASEYETYEYIVTAVDEYGGEGVSLSSGYFDSCTNALSLTGNINTITWSSNPNAETYRVYRSFQGVSAFVGQTTSTTFIDNNIAPDISRSVPIVDTFGSTYPRMAGYRPGAVTYFQQRKVFGGSLNDPQGVFMTASNSETNICRRYISPMDTDALRFRVAAREVSTIRHLVPMNELIALTSSAELVISGEPITPTNISAKPQSYIGASNVQPVVVNNSLLFAAVRGGHVRELGYNFSAGGYLTGDLSLRAPHLFDNLTIVDMAYTKSPQPIVWFVSSNGRLLGLTYVPEQQIGAWHWHDTDGEFESITAVAEGNEDVLYAVVKRTIDGSTVRYVERMASRQFTDLEDAFFVDCGATFDGANTGATTVTVTGGTTWGPADTLTITASSALFAYPAQTDVGDAIVFEDADGTQYRLEILATSSTTVATAQVDKVLAAAWRSAATTDYWFARNTISGLTWLEGKEVAVLGDGAVFPRQTVTGGVITLERAVCKAQIGLPITSDLQPLPIAAAIDYAYGQGRAKNINKVTLRVYRSSGVFVGPDEDHLTEAKQRTTEAYGQPPSLKSEEIEVMITPSWSNDGGQVFIRQSDPLPLTVVSIASEYSVGG